MKLEEYYQLQNESEQSIDEILAVYDQVSKRDRAIYDKILTSLNQIIDACDKHIREKLSE